MDLKDYRIDDSIGFRIYRTYMQNTAVMRKAFATAGLALTPEQWTVLMRIRDHEGLSQSELGQRAIKDRHNINRLVNILEAGGYIERRPHKTDNRAYQLYLTDTATAALEESHRVVMAHGDNAYRGLSAEDRASLCRILDRIMGNLATADDSARNRIRTSGKADHKKRKSERQSARQTSKVK